MIDKQELYNRTNAGLDIIRLFYPADEKKAFKIRESEKTASAHLKRINGVWHVTDFGGDGKALSPIDVCMKEKNASVAEAFKFLASRFGLANTPAYKPLPATGTFSSRKATEAEPDKWFSMEEKAFTKEELELLAPGLTADQAAALGWRSLQSYSFRSKEKPVVVTVSSTPDYPVFCRKCPVQNGKELSYFYKIYKPKDADKAYRFLYLPFDAKPQAYINGLHELQAAYKGCQDKQIKELAEAKQMEAAQELTPEEIESMKKRVKKFERCFLVSGERDALVIKSWGEHPVWLNSETDASFSEYHFRLLTKCCERVYQVPDIDKTGLNTGYERARKFIDLFTVLLPDSLLAKRCWRGNPLKDLRDYAGLYSRYDFLSLLNNAYTVKFWEYVQPDKGKYRWEVNIIYLEWFFKCFGYMYLVDKVTGPAGEETEEYLLVRIENNIISRVSFAQMQKFIHDYVRSKMLPIDVQKLIMASERISETRSSLDFYYPDFTNCTESEQMLFFANKFIRISAGEITEQSYRDCAVNVWRSKQIQVPFYRRDNSFKITYDQGEFDIAISDANESRYLKYLTNASRIFWRKEFEHEFDSPDAAAEYYSRHRFAIDGNLLDAEEIREQKLHLINKIYAIGYLVFRHKFFHQNYAVYAIDAHFNEDENAIGGGSGKSAFFLSLDSILNIVKQNGRDKNLTKNAHVLEGIHKNTDLFFIDDCDKHTQIDFFFPLLTTGTNVNPKNRAGYFLKFEESPKLAISSNYIPRHFDDAILRRLLFVVFSDYYHVHSELNDYRETRKISDDFGKDIMRGNYPADEWNAEYNFIADCVQFYLRCNTEFGREVVCHPPMRVVKQRSLVSKMISPEFYEWAEGYFDPDNGHVDVMIEKQLLFNEFTSSVQTRYRWTSQAFSIALNAYVDYCDHIIELNPAELCNAKNKRIQKFSSALSKVTDFVYLRTKKELNG
jgi:hypothetical protein